MIEGERLARLKRRCSGGCGETKSWAEFWPRRRWPDGTVRDVQAYCRVCSAASQRRSVANNREHRNREAKRRRDAARANPEAYAQQAARRRARQRDSARRRDNIPPERWRKEKPPLDYLTAQWADGRMLYDWLTRREVITISDSYEERTVIGPAGDGASLGATVARVLGKWKNGHIARIDAVDNILTQLGSHISELPDEVWVEKRKQC